MPVELSVVIPAYNEQDRIARTLQKIGDYCRKTQVAHEVIVVDDGSQDHTAWLVREHIKAWKQFRLQVLERNRGKGYATRMGVLAAKGRWILCSDADLSTPIEEVGKLVKVGQKHAVVIGSRSLPESEILVQPPLHRIVVGRVFNWIVRAVVARGYVDTQCGFKLYRCDAAQEIFSRLTIDGFAFDVEVLYLAHRLGYAVLEVPVVWRNDNRSKVNLFADSAKMFLDVISIRWRHARRK